MRLLRCGECGRSITAEEKIKKQKNGNVHTYVYYRCTKKGTVCSQPFIREEALVAELSEVMGQYALPHDWAAELRSMADKDEREAAQSTATASQATREEIMAIEKKLHLLLEARLEEDIDRDTYREQKAELLSRKKGLEEKMAGSEQGTGRLARTPAGVDKRRRKSDGNRSYPHPLVKKILGQKILRLDPLS